MYLISEQKCPYCHKDLDKEPKKKTTHKECGNSFRVVTRPSDGKKVIATEAEYQKFQQEWGLQSATSEFRKSLVGFYREEKDIIRNKVLDKKKLSISGLFGVDVSVRQVTYSDAAEKRLNSAFEKEAKNLKKKFSKDPGEQDVLWSLANKLAEGFMQSGKLSELGNLYFLMALLMNQTGRSSFRLQQESQKIKLMEEKKNSISKKVEILSTDDSCDVCKNQQGKVFMIDEAIKKMPLPAKCKNKLNELSPDGWCRCIYLPVTNEK